MDKFGEFILKYLKGKNWNTLLEVGIGFNFKTLKYLITNTEKNKKIIIIEKNKKATKKIRESINNQKIKILNTKISTSYNPKDKIDLLYSVRPNPELIKPLKKISNKNESPLLIRPFTTDEYKKDLELKNHKGLPILIYQNE